ncbi:50S ribosomal protein L6 [Halarchaeum nitratireducens]|uniref:Large ribosomal subunit protein uL6 n=1 Tax=Halarchaeum nitratireducens TaxID=489913 RepID=A0A830G869_9EURY|nr:MULTISPECIES: 50S ribosomal protein L6 [Halarchaeum]MBP2251338.1 large subunit ribosomal protein L6 [Halarchaeum solikamskense]GGN07905.1 50S ribosomal protein L6 [Halarchaeum nitratireducens]
MTRTELEIPDDVDAEVDHLELTVEGPNGSVTRRLWYPDVRVSVDDGAVVIEAESEDAKTNATVGTFESHITNMFHGVTEGWEYRMQVHYSHFPMQVTVEDDEVVIENFLGEKAPRRAEIRGDTDVQIDGEELTLSGSDKESVGQTAADIEQLTRVTDKDTRVFQDGVYIVEKPTKGGA